MTVALPIKVFFFINVLKLVKFDSYYHTSNGNTLPLEVNQVFTNTCIALKSVMVKWSGLILERTSIP